MKRFVCAELHPGCVRVFTGPTDQAVLDRVLAHAAADHGVARPSMAFIERVVIATHPLQGAEPRRLTLVGAEPPDRSGPITGAGHRAGRRLGPAGRFGHGAAGPATVTALTDRRARAHRTYRHECWLYRGDTEFVDMMVPFIADGLAREQPIMVAVPQPRLHALRDALGDDAAGVAWADMAGLGANPARIIPAWQEFLDKHRGDRRPVRGIGQPIWPGRGEAELVEAQIHEALLNLAVPRHTPAVAALAVRHRDAPGHRHRQSAAQPPGARPRRRPPRRNLRRRRRDARIAVRGPASGDRLHRGWEI